MNAKERAGLMVHDNGLIIRADEKRVVETIFAQLSGLNLWVKFPNGQHWGEAYKAEVSRDQDNGVLYVTLTQPKTLFKDL